MKRGLTLIEVILATAIMAMGLSVLLVASSRCLAVMKAAKNYQSAQWVMSIAECEYPIDATNDVKKLEIDPKEYLKGFTYSRTVEDDEDKDGLYVVRCRVTWTERNKDAFEEAVRYVLQTKK